MKVGVLGGTGKLGLALALRLDRTGHEVMIGSRDATKGSDAAAKLDGNVRAGTNPEAAAWCEAAIISVPYSGHRALLESVQGRLSGKIVIDATVPIDPANRVQIRTESGTSATEETAAMFPDSHVFAAFQTISFRVLRQEDRMHDVLVAGTSSRKTEVMNLIRSMGMRPVDAGPTEVAGHIEHITVLLIAINMANRIKESGIEITGI
jgi:NADPH-dependent F420 reductase